MKNTSAAARGRSAAFPTRRLLIATLILAAFGITGCRMGLPETDAADTGSTQQQTAGDTTGGASDGGGATGGNGGTGDTGGTTGDTGGTTGDTGGTTGDTGGTTGDTGTTTGDTGGTTGDTGGTTGDTGGITGDTGGTTGDTGGTTITGSMNLNWRAPSERESGDALALTELGGYRIYYGPLSAPTANVVSVSDPAVMSYTITGLPAGTYQVAVSAVDGDGVESTLSNSLNKTIQ